PYAKLDVSEYKKKFSEIISRNLPEVIRFETNCSYSLLQLEFEIFKDEPASLAKKYLERNYLVIDKITAGIFWALAEELKTNDENDMAIKVWNMIIEKGDSDLPEVKYAKKRLDKSKTVLEDLWNR
ncbi:MAG: hypothetical protein HQK54_12970, partial [Oligoflexales bacterium]|nr:hypothetical protein [Oligoflexales bacterium]